MSDKISKRADNFSKWYLDVIREADLADQAPVRGCVVFKANGYSVWEAIQAELDLKFKNSGHRNVYFPLLIPESFLNKEKEHIAGFSPELAVVTHAGGKELEEALVVRPTSEAIFGHMYSKWIKSYRDLPLLYNQWCNVMRWELRPRFFLRTSEFLWQEGHTAHETLAEAEEETKKMLKIYHQFLVQDCLLPSYSGLKPAHEKFPGAYDTYTLEGVMQDGKALQLCTSHNLGQNFSKAFDIKFLSRENVQEYVWTTSWGLSTRVIGSIIMAHGDDNGVIFPPKIAPISAVIVPIGLGDDEKSIKYIDDIIDLLSETIPKFKIRLDENNHMRPGERFHIWEAQGVPIRIEVGPNEIESKTVTLVRRDNRAKTNVPISGLKAGYNKAIDEFSTAIFARALKLRDDMTVEVDSYEEFKEIMKTKGGFIYAHWDGTYETAEKIKNETKATIRVIPTELEAKPGVCILSGKPSARRVIFAQAY